jgi:two-component system, LuxR family, response regulator FixJ
MKKKITVWVVDDDSSVRKALKRLLRSAGYPVRTFASAIEFLDSGETKDGILVLDVKMPGLNGFDLQKKLVGLGADIPIIFISAHYDVQARSDVVPAGAVAFLQKPFNDQDLLDAINLADQVKR